MFMGHDQMADLLQGDIHIPQPAQDAIAAAGVCQKVSGAVSNGEAGVVAVYGNRVAGSNHI